MGLVLAATFAGPTAGSEPAAEGPALREPIVLFTDAHREKHAPWDTGGTGLSRATLALRGAGYAVGASHRPIPEALAGLGDGDVLVVGLATDPSLSAADVEAIESFAARGGGVLFLVEHDDYFGGSTRANLVTARWGIRTGMSGVLDPENSVDALGQWIRVQALGLPSILFFAAPLEVSSPAVVLATSGPRSEPPSAAVIAEAPVGRGRVTVVADAEWVWNGNAAFGIQAGSNEALLLALVDRLSPAPRTARLLPDALPALDTAQAAEYRIPLPGGIVPEVASEGYSAVLSPGPGAATLVVESNGAAEGVVRLRATGPGGARDEVFLRFLAPGADTATAPRILLDGRAGARGVDAGPSGLLSLARALRDAGAHVVAGPVPSPLDAGFDAIVLANPIEPIAARALAASLPARASLALLLEPHLDLASGHENPTRLKTILDKATQAPHAPLLERVGLLATESILMSRAEWADASLRLPGVATTPAHRVGGFLPGPGSALAPLALGAPGTWGDLEGTLWLNVQDVPDLDPWDLRAPWYAAGNATVLVLGDADFTANEAFHAGSPLADVLYRFLDFPRVHLAPELPAAAGDVVRFRGEIVARPTAAPGMNADVSVALPPGWDVADPGTGAPGEGSRLTWKLEGAPPSSLPISFALASPRDGVSAAIEARGSASGAGAGPRAIAGRAGLDLERLGISASLAGPAVSRVGEVSLFRASVRSDGNATAGILNLTIDLPPGLLGIPDEAQAGNWTRPPWISRTWNLSVPLAPGAEKTVPVRILPLAPGDFTLAIRFAAATGRGATAVAGTAAPVQARM